MEAALKEAATKHKRRYRDIIQQMGGSDNSSRRFYHDDITVLVFFVNDRTRDTIEEFSYKGFSNLAEISRFERLKPYDDILVLYQQIKPLRETVEKIKRRQTYLVSPQYCPELDWRRREN